MAEFDFNGARAAGYSNDEILRYLTSPGIQPIPGDRSQKLQQLVDAATARNQGRPAMGPPQRPAMGPPQAPAEIPMAGTMPWEAEGAPGQRTGSLDEALGQRQLLPDWAETARNAIQRDVAGSTGLVTPADLPTIPKSPAEAVMLAAGALIPPERMLAGAKGLVQAGTTALEGGAPETVLGDVIRGARSPEVAPGDFLTGVHAPEVTPVRGNIPAEMRAAQESQMDPRRLEKLEQVRSENPELRGATSFMDPLEAGKMVASGSNVKAVGRLLDELPTAAHMAALATAGQPKQGWYRASTQAIIDVFGWQDAPRFASLLASMSPQTSVESNLKNALTMWKNWTAAGRPTDPESIKFLLGQSVQGDKGAESILGAWENNTIRSLRAQDPRNITLSGPKVDSFYRNLADNVHRGTLDAWMANGLGVDQKLFAGSANDLQLSVGDPGMGPGYIATNARLRQAANAARMHTSEAQEAIWSLVMPLYEMQKKTGMPAREILDKGLLTPEVIRGTPDFSTLLHDPSYGRILEKAGYGEQLAALRAHQWPEAKSLDSLSTAQQRYVDQTARTIEQLGANRLRESRSVTVPGEGRPESAFAFASPTQIPPQEVGHLPGAAGAPYGSQENLSRTIGGNFQNVQGRDVLYESLGMEPLQTRPATSVSGGKAEPAYSVGVEAPVSKRGALDIPQWFKDRLNAVEAARAAMTGQPKAKWQAQIPDPEGTSLVFPAKGKGKPEGMVQAAAALPAGSSVADLGAGRAIVNEAGAALSSEERDHLKSLIGETKLKPGETAPPPYSTTSVSNTIDYAKEWAEAPGSGAVTRKMFGYLDRLRAPELKRLDTALRSTAGDLVETYTQKAASMKQPLRGDLMNMLTTLRDKGLDGVRASLDAGGYLPAIALALIGGQSALRPSEDSAGSRGAPAPSRPAAYSTQPGRM